MQTITVREFRAKMGEHFAQPKPLGIGNRYRVAALVIPIPTDSDRQWSNSKIQIRAARTAALAAFKELETAAND